MQPGTEIRYHTEFLAVRIRFRGNGVGDRKEAIDAAPTRHPLVERPGDDHLVADIGMNLAAMGDDRIIDVVKEAREQILHTQFAHRFGERGRAGEIEKHQHALLRRPGSAIPPQGDVQQHAAAVQRLHQLQTHHPHQQNAHEPQDMINRGKSSTQPEGFDPVPIKQRLPE